MIYAFICTQVLTVAAGLVGLRFVIEYLRERDLMTKEEAEFNRDQFFKVLVEHEKHIDSILERSVHERELLLERIQHPVMTQGQAAGAGKDQEIDVSFVDEEAMAGEDFPESEIETVIKPIQPVEVGNNGRSDEPA